MANLRKDFSKIYDENVRRIYRFIFLKVSSEETAQDLTSQTFLQGWEAFKKSKIQNPKGPAKGGRVAGGLESKKKEIRNPSAFLYQIARNLVIDFYRKKGQTEVISTETEGLVLTDPKDTPSAIEAEIAVNSQMGQVKKVLASLKSDDQDVIIWYYLDGLSIPKIAKILGKNEGTVRVMIHRGLKKLREELEK